MDILAAADVLILEEIRKSRVLYLSLFFALVILEAALILKPSLFASETMAMLWIGAVVVLSIAFFITFLKAAAFALDIPSWLIFVILLAPRFVPIPGLALLIILILAVLVEVKIKEIARSLKKQSEEPAAGA